MADERGSVYLAGGRVVDPASGRDELADVLVADGRVAAIGPPDALAERRRALEAAHGPMTRVALKPTQIVAPGFVDLSAHAPELAGDAGETILSAARAAAAGGFTTLCRLPDAEPASGGRALLASVLGQARGAPARVHRIAALTTGEGGLSELAELAEAGAVAFADDSRDDGRGSASGRLMRAALAYAAPLGLPIVASCQDGDLVGGGVLREGAISTLLGLPGWPAAAEEVRLARDLALVRATGARYHAAHLSTAGAVALVREAKCAGLPVTASVTPHHLLLTEAWVAGERTGPLAEALGGLPPGARYDTNTKVSPPLGSAADCAALLAGLLDGTIDAIATDHTPRAVVEKDCEYAEAAFGISGLETALAALLALVHAGRLPLGTLVAALTERPARVFGLEAGTLRPDAPADLVVFDSEEAWTVDPARFVSRGRNTPLAGVPLRGRVHLTLLGGAVVYDAGEGAGG